MTVTATTSATTPILAIDLGKYKSVACWYDPATATASARFESFTASALNLQRVLGSQRPTVVIEACALAGWVRDFCRDAGLDCHVANTASEAWKFKHAKRKTDRDDARRLAELTALGQLPTVAAADPATRQ